MFGEILGEVLMWIVGLLAWANIFIWGAVIALGVLNVVIGFVVGIVRGMR